MPKKLAKRIPIKHTRPTKKFTIIRDVQEKSGNGWFLDSKILEEDKSNWDIDVIIEHLSTGDYTLQGLEDFVCIERKGGVIEWSQNVTESRFERELIRLRDNIKYPYILFEFHVSSIINIEYERQKLRRKYHNKIKVGGLSGKAILQKTIEMTMDYNIPIFFCGARGEDMALSILKRAFEYHKKYKKAENKQ